MKYFMNSFASVGLAENQVLKAGEPTPVPETDGPLHVSVHEVVYNICFPLNRPALRLQVEDTAVMPTGHDGIEQTVEVLDFEPEKTWVAVPELSTSISPFWVKPFWVSPFWVKPFCVKPFWVNPFWVNPFESLMEPRAEPRSSGSTSPPHDHTPRHVSKNRVERMRGPKQIRSQERVPTFRTVASVTGVCAERVV